MEGEDHSAAFKAFETAAWNANAPGYDRLTGRITAHAAEALLDAAGVTAGTRVLDVGCGPGHLCAAAAARGARPTGVDLSDGMLAVARRAHPGLDFTRGDAEALPFGEGAFDAVLGAFVVNHLPRPERAAAEIRRVLAPGGRAALAMWDLPDRVAFLGLFEAAMRAAGVTPPPTATPEGPPPYRFSDPAELRALLGGAGLRDVTVRQIAVAHPVAGADELWDGVLTGSMRTAAQIRAVGDEDRARVRAALDDLVEARRSASGVRLDAVVQIAVGVSPGA